MSSQSLTGPPPVTPAVATHEIRGGLTLAEEITTPGTSSPAAEMMLGLWTSWLAAARRDHGQGFDPELDPARGR
jgi:hypothetical protein